MGNPLKYILQAVTGNRWCIGYAGFLSGANPEGYYVFHNKTQEWAGEGTMESIIDARKLKAQMNQGRGWFSPHSTGEVNEDAEFKWTCDRCQAKWPPSLMFCPNKHESQQDTHGDSEG